MSLKKHLHPYEILEDCYHICTEPDSPISSAHVVIEMLINYGGESRFLRVPPPTLHSMVVRRVLQYSTYCNSGIPCINSRKQPRNATGILMAGRTGGWAFAYIQDSRLGRRDLKNLARGKKWLASLQHTGQSRSAAKTFAEKSENIYLRESFVLPYPPAIVSAAISQICILSARFQKPRSPGQLRSA